MSEYNVKTNAVFVHVILFYCLRIIKTVRSFHRRDNSTTGRRKKNNLISKQEHILFSLLS